jgi:hypothetical protein
LDSEREVERERQGEKDIYRHRKVDGKREVKKKGVKQNQRKAELILGSTTLQ